MAEAPADLVVYGGSGRAARNWAAFDAIVTALKSLENDETLLVQSGKPVGIFRTHSYAPRVLIANSNLVGRWATWEHFRDLERRGLMMYGQMTAGSWIYIGTQGILQGTYEVFAEIARRRNNGDLAGTLTLTAGLGGMGGAQPLSVTMNNGVAIVVEVDRHRIERRLETRYLDKMTDDLDAALEMARTAQAARRPLSIGLLGNAADIFPAFVERGIIPDMVTDQTSAHDELNGYVPNGMTLAEANALRESDPTTYRARSMAAMATHCRAMIALKERGAEVFDYGNNLRGQALAAGVKNAFDYPGFVPAYIRGGPFRRFGRYLSHRCPHPRTVPRGQGPAALDRHGPGTGPVPGAAVADLLAGIWGADPFRPGHERTGPER